MASTIDDGDEAGRPGRWPRSVRDLFTMKGPPGPVTRGERVRSVGYGLVGVVLLVAAVGVIHLIDGSRRFDRSDLSTLGVVTVVLSVLGYVAPRFTTSPSMAALSRHDVSEAGWSGKLALVVFGLLVLVLGAVRFYY